MIDEFDDDDNGQIDFNEFKRLIKKMNVIKTNNPA